MTRSALLVLLVACSPPSDLGEAKVPVRLTGSPPDASVTVDDRYIGSLEFVAAHGGKMHEGQHRVTIEAPGYFPLDVMVDAKEGKVIRIDAKLVPIPD